MQESAGSVGSGLFETEGVHSEEITVINYRVKIFTVIFMFLVGDLCT